MLKPRQVGAMLVCAMAPLTAPFSAHAAGAPAQERRAELLNMIRHDCGSCHGLTLAGGLGLPLLPETLKDKPPEALKETILRGRGGTPMPPWQAFISEEEAAWIVDLLLKGLPDAR